MAVIGPIRRTPWGRLLPVSVGSVVARTYAEFQAHIATLAPPLRPWAADFSFASDTVFRTTASAASLSAATMSGSSWQSAVRRNAVAPARLVQHGLPSEDAFTGQIAGGFDCLVRLPILPDNAVTPALDRNGYLSLSSSGNRGECTEIIYWDGTQAQRMQPSLGLGPTLYTW